LAAVPILQTQSNEIGDAVDAQLGQQSRLVNLDGPRADVECARNVAVVPASNDFVHHFPFAGGQGRQQARGFSLPIAVFLRRALAAESLVDRPQEFVVVDRLFEEVDCLTARPKNPADREEVPAHRVPTDRPRR